MKLYYLIKSFLCGTCPKCGGELKIEPYFTLVPMSMVKLKCKKCNHIKIDVGI